MNDVDRIMALARETGQVERRHCIGKAQGFDVRDAYEALRAAVEAQQADAERYRWLFADGALEEFKAACDLGGSALLSERGDLLHTLLGFVIERKEIDAAIDAARSKI